MSVEYDANSTARKKTSKMDPYLLKLVRWQTSALWWAGFFVSLQDSGWDDYIWGLLSRKYFEFTEFRPFHEIPVNWDIKSVGKCIKFI